MHEWDPGNEATNLLAGFDLGVCSDLTAGLAWPPGNLWSWWSWGHIPHDVRNDLLHTLQWTTYDGVCVRVRVRVGGGGQLQLGHSGMLQFSLPVLNYNT